MRTPPAVIANTTVPTVRPRCHYSDFPYSSSCALNHVRFLAAVSPLFSVPRLNSGQQAAAAVQACTRMQGARHKAEYKTRQGQSTRLPVWIWIEDPVGVCQARTSSCWASSRWADASYPPILLGPCSRPTAGRDVSVGCIVSWPGGPVYIPFRPPTRLVAGSADDPGSPVALVVSWWVFAPAGSDHCACMGSPTHTSLPCIPREVVAVRPCIPPLIPAPCCPPTIHTPGCPSPPPLPPCCYNPPHCGWTPLRFNRWCMQEGWQAGVYSLLFPWLYVAAAASARTPRT